MPLLAPSTGCWPQGPNLFPVEIGGLANEASLRYQLP